MTSPTAPYKLLQRKRQPVLIASSALCSRFQKLRGESFATALKRAEQRK